MCLFLCIKKKTKGGMRLPEEDQATAELRGSSVLVNREAVGIDERFPAGK